MKSLNRREFLDTAKKTSVGLAAGVTILQSAKSVRGYPANEKVILAIVGLGGRGPHLANGFLDRGDCEIAYGCDPNAKQFPKISESRVILMAMLCSPWPSVLTVIPLPQHHGVMMQISMLPTAVQPVMILTPPRPGPLSAVRQANWAMRTVRGVMPVISTVIAIPIPWLRLLCALVVTPPLSYLI